MAAGAGAAASGDRGALRLRVSDSAGADEKPLEGPAGPQTDSADLHAWAEAFCRARVGLGWIDVGTVHGRGAHSAGVHSECLEGRADRGTVEPANVEFSYSMSVRRLNETPRRPKPFSEEEWAARWSRWRTSVDADLEGAGCAADHGRRADVCGHRRAGEPAVEHRCAGAR
jgi:hypothetical protein